MELFGTEAGAILNPLTLYRMEDGATQDIRVDPPPGLESWDNIAAHFHRQHLGWQAIRSPTPARTYCATDDGSPALECRNGKGSAD